MCAGKDAKGSPLPPLPVPTCLRLRHTHVPPCGVGPLCGAGPLLRPVLGLAWGPQPAFRLTPALSSGQLGSSRFAGWDRFRACQPFWGRGCPCSSVGLVQVLPCLTRSASSNRTVKIVPTAFSLSRPRLASFRLPSPRASRGLCALRMGPLGAARCAGRDRFCALR